MFLLLINRLVNDIEFFKIRDKPLAPFLATRLELTRARLFSGVEIPPKSNEMIKLCEDFNIDLTIHDSFFKEAFQLALAKFDKHINNNSTISIFTATRCFDPRFIQLQPHHHNILLYKDIKEFKNPRNELITEWGIYCGLNELFEEDFDLDSYWQEKLEILPNLSKLAVIYIWLPISGVDVERSFSAYNRILADNRQNLSENSISMLNFLNFNK